eukprot:CAMPEP_0172672302 /NCGR_PEP_ID=MMETSP1074-20121228/11462_1 /TAXON_ID=2916 /ORGANISM="Ceratium fusus, Strain PA161109" /LENGTH=279 /DNA_ID=CAMNT_0013489471 /DNA_START=1 /DNA_END=841 /DNA_ORIENTATION=-
MSAEDDCAQAERNAASSTCVAGAAEAFEAQAEQTECNLADDAKRRNLTVRLMSGANIDVPIRQGQTESSLRGHVARILARPTAEVLLLVHDRPLSDADLTAPHLVPVLTAVVKAPPTVWLDSVLGEVDDIKSMDQLVVVVPSAVQQTFGDLALELKRKVQVSAAMEAVVGLWRYGPRFRDDSYFYGIKFEGDGSCRIMEGSERYTEHYGEIVNETIGTARCEWRGRWWMPSPGSDIEVEAFPILEAQDESEEMQMCHQEEFAMADSRTMRLTQEQWALL